MKPPLIVIPARFHSTRFPGKVLALLGGKSILEWCWTNAVKADIGPVLIATEDEKVVSAARDFGAKAVLTSPQCLSGSDRVFEASQNIDSPIVINIQADQPFLTAETIKSVAQVLQTNPKADIATAVIPLNDPARLKNPNVVKAVVCQDRHCLYFSRSPVPFARNGKPAYFEHLGIYGYRKEALKKFVGLKPSPIELAESLEQLRALDAGMTIYTSVCSEIPCSIDTPEDLEEAKQILEKTHLKIAENR